MTKIIFVGDKATDKNTILSIPFVGTKSFDRLVTWIAKIDPDYYLVYNSDDDVSLLEVKLLQAYQGFKVIALGNNASKRLNKFSTYHHKIDHPSGLNRNLNSHDYVEKMLNDCKEWLNK